LGGASFGAIATLSTAARFPDTFGRLLLQSGSFDGASPDGLERTDSLWRPVNEFVTGFVSQPYRITDRAFMSCGIYEPLICENRALRPILANTDTTVLMAEALDGHTWGCWRDNLGVGLPWLFADTFRPRDVRPFERPEADTRTGSQEMGSSNGA
jgi:enterochelin esterase family protein